MAAHNPSGAWKLRFTLKKTRGNACGSKHPLIPGTRLRLPRSKIMDEAIKSLGDALRKSIPITGAQLPKDMRRLIAELQCREAQRDRKGERPQKPKPS